MYRDAEGVLQEIPVNEDVTDREIDAMPDLPDVTIVIPGRAMKRAFLYMVKTAVPRMLKQQQEEQSKQQLKQK